VRAGRLELLPVFASLFKGDVLLEVIQTYNGKSACSKTRYRRNNMVSKEHYARFLMVFVLFAVLAT